jgi:hypothetical protein
VQDFAVKLISRFVQGEMLERGFGAVGWSQEKVQGEGRAPFSAKPIGIELSRTTGVSDTHSYKFESD